MKKILAITGIRSDYDLLSSLYRRLSNDADVDFRLLVGGAHLSKTYGYTVDLIKKDGIPILAMVESLMDSDTPSSRLKTASIMLQSSIDIVASWAPDLILYAGDREEVWIGALLGVYLEIPTVHFYGGDHTVTGHVDNPVRHAVSKLSTVHMVTIEEHKRRLQCLGESDSRIYVIGNISLDNFITQERIPFGELKARLGIPTKIDQYALVIFHPDPSERSCAAEIFENILKELKRTGLGGCVGYPNTDPSNKVIIDVMNKYRDDPSFYFYRNLCREDFISLYKQAQCIVGNSSSGIMEAASIPIPAVNVGLRQVGRLAGENVIFCGSSREEINDALRKVISEEFRRKIATMKNPYGDGKSAELAHRILLENDFATIRLKTEDPLDLGCTSLINKEAL